MNSRIKDLLEGQEANYILPFFWQHGEEEGVLREEMAKIDESGIKAVCVEARPHPDFLGPKWWQDIDVIMDEARRRGMKVWFLDDDHFPTGHAAGRIVDAPKELRRLFLTEAHIDAVGPMKHASFLVSKGEGTLVGVIAVKRDHATGELDKEYIDVTSFVQDGVLYWDLPGGYWRIFLLIETTTGGSKQQENYLNPLVAESVKVLIDTVHEAFYERYREDFGSTFAGFFSDEPGFYNDKDTFNFDSKLGKKNVPLPWSPDLLELLEKELGDDYRLYLPLLWHDGEKAAFVRYTYMSIITRLYGERFTQQIGDWCRERNVEYIGHVLEDNNVHTRLGSGAGHFFRALWGQDMSGLDVVLWQIVPGFDEVPFTWIAGETDSEFFHYGMAKMAVSLSHIDPKKKGRTMAEVFGAYGWAEGLKLMKWLTDHMLVRGVNYFVPHAFSPKEFPDHDCPPHMYARGKNPQYRYYKVLNQYTNRVSHLLSGGNHIACAAVLYHAEAEWSGEYMPFQKPVKQLLQNQIDCDILPIDTILTSASVSKGKLKVLEESFDCLIIPYSEALPILLLKRLEDLADEGLPVLFIAELPVRACEQEHVSETLKKLTTHPMVWKIELEHLIRFMREKGFYEVKVENYQPYLRYYHVEYSDVDGYMFFNEHPYNSVETTVTLQNQGKVLFYDPINNVMKEPKVIETEGGMKINLSLAPYESVIMLIGEEMKNIPVVQQPKVDRGMEVKGNWEVSITTSEQYPAFQVWKEMNTLKNLSLSEELPSFTGTFRYKIEFVWNQTAMPIQIDLGDVFETADVWLNGDHVGIRICPPYRLDIEGFVKQGVNTLIIEVTNTLVKAQRDFLSQFAQQEPSGLLGPVRLYY
ncbi:glycosyl transferase family 2 [Bacillus sp. SA1-12]|uniref:glycosylhydrolase-like jelly roll fold domain-containing protein n=1 Tax=Bacillus sp. SA1-12 TaxID=1455638 RepID=UPI000625EC1A|nr:glycosylhydrolase-like jelly roll fold domain-containing protein [Bacillus sp. SA1-12]KKI92392.1 glycosyl transferase family 2 [Bacillus sp. SA1-12]